MMEEPRSCNLSSILSLKWGNTPQLKESFDSNAHPMKQSSHESSAPAGEQYQTKLTLNYVQEPVHLSSADYHATSPFPIKCLRLEVSLV